MTSGNAFLIGIIGSGPIGLECGLRALQYGYRFVIFESGDDIASNVRSWSHVRLFTPLSMNMSPLGRAHVQTDNDDNAYLSGNEYIERYLRPLSCHLQSNIRLHHQVISVGRHHTNGFVILVKNGQTSREEYIFVDYVIDASGTYGCPNFAGPGKLPAINERSLRLAALPLISYRVPSERDEYLPGKRIVLIGKGDSAATSVVFLAQLKKHYPETQLFWVIKQSIDHLPYCSNPEDPLEQRRHVADEANRIYADGVTFNKIYTNTVVTQFIPTLSSTAVDVTLEASPPQFLRNIDYVIVNTGLQPDRSLYANLNVHECPRTKGPIALAAKLLSSIGSDCLEQISHGANSLMTSEKNFFIVGNKSYGTLNNFLIKIGFEQVDLVFQLINTSREVSRDVIENYPPICDT